MEYVTVRKQLVGLKQKQERCRKPTLQHVNTSSEYQTAVNIYSTGEICTKLVLIFKYISKVFLLIVHLKMQQVKMMCAFFPWMKYPVVMCEGHLSIVNTCLKYPVVTCEGHLSIVNTYLKYPVVMCEGHLSIVNTCLKYPVVTCEGHLSIVNTCLKYPVVMC